MIEVIVGLISAFVLVALVITMVGGGLFSVSMMCTWCESIPDKIIAHAMKTPYFHLPGYMNRYWIVPFADPSLGNGSGPVSWRRPFAKLLQRFGIAVRVHEILRSDRGRWSHNHPWWYLTIILKGGYWETRYDNDGDAISKTYHGAGSILFRKVNTFHRLTVAEGYPAWTLFVTGPKSQSWGFMVWGAFVPHREHREDQ